MADVHEHTGAIDTKEPDAHEKLRSRHFFIRLIHSYPTQDDDVELILRAIAAAPDRWLKVSSALALVQNLTREQPELGAVLLARMGR